AAGRSPAEGRASLTRTATWLDRSYATTRLLCLIYLRPFRAYWRHVRRFVEGSIDPPRSRTLSRQHAVPSHCASGLRRGLFAAEGTARGLGGRAAGSSALSRRARRGSMRRPWT